MRSKTSFFNATLYKKNLSRFWPLWGLASFVGALFPLTMILQLMHYDGSHPMLDLVDAKEGLYAMLTMAVPIVSLLYAVLCAAAVWSYLYNSRSVGMMHRLPVRREGLFVTNFLSGMTMMLIPYVVTGILTVVMFAMAGALAVDALGLTVLGVLGESFFYFCSATFVAFLTGNVFAMPVLYFLLHFLQPLVSTLLQVLQGEYYYGVMGNYSGSGEWLCPTVHMVNNVNVLYTREQVMEGGYLGNRTVDVALGNAWIIGVYALAGVVLLALAYVLYRRRKSECASDVAAVAWMRPVFRYGGALLCGVAGGMLLYNLTWRPTQSSQQISTVPLAVCMAIMGLIGYYAVCMVLEKSLRVFRGSIPGAAAAVVLLALLCAVVSLDLFHIESRVPESDRVEEIVLRTNANVYRLKAGEHDQQIEQVLALHQAIVEDLDYLEDANWNGNSDTEQFESVDLEYTLKNGQYLNRNYSLYMRLARMDQEGTFEYELDQLIRSAPMQLLRLKIMPDVKVTSGTIWDESGDVQMDLTASQAEQIRDAVGRDAEQGHWGAPQWDLSTPADRVATSTIYFSELVDGQVGPTYVDAIDLYIRKDMPETLACLRQLGLMEQDSYRLIAPDTPSAERVETETDGVILENAAYTTVG